MRDYKQIWQNVIDGLEKAYLPSSIQLWFGDSEIVLIDETKVVISILSILKIETVKRKYMDTMHTLFTKELGYDPEIILILPDEKSSYEKSENSIAPDKAAPRSIPSNAGGFSLSDINFEYTFENFIVGTSNQFAHAACTAVARNPATDYNPLFIYGSSGLGKTHLLNAIMNELRHSDKNYSIVYVKGEDFTNQLIESLRTGNQAKFRDRYRNTDVLLIDDIQFIAGKESTQEEFFHTFNALYENRKQIILTSDRPPKDIKTLEDRLRTRFEWGLIADIQPPDFELRIAIMKKKARLIGMTLPDEVLTYIAEKLKTNVREIEGAVKRICARSFLSGEKITLDMAKNCIAAFVTADEPVSVTAERIVDRVAKKYGISTEDIYGRKRTKHIAYARAVSIYIIRKITDMSFPVIGKTFERDHSTIISSNQMIAEEIAKNPLLEIEINDLIKEITE